MSYDEVEHMLTVERVGDHYKYTTMKRLLVRAERDGVRLVPMFQLWTGVGTASEPIMENRNHTAFYTHKPEEGGETWIFVYLGRPLSRGDVEEVKLTQHWEDDVRQMIPFHWGGSGRISAKKLTITTRFKTKDDPGEEVIQGIVKNRRRRDPKTAGAITYKRESKKGYVDYIQVINHPKRHHSYGINWR